MKTQSKLVPVVLAMLFTLLPIGGGAFAAPKFGGSDGGGGYQYPNSKMLLKKVSEPLAKQIEAMDDKAFAKFPRNLRKAELAKIIRTVVPLPETYRERPNADGELEGLMFDYDRNYCDQSGCGPRILALKPFYDAYKGLPVQQLERERVKNEMYDLTIKDIRQRLLHEAAHLLNIAITPATDHQGDEFADRLQQAMASQYVVCESPDWRDDSAGPLQIYDGLIIHLQSGDLGYAWMYSYPQLSRADGVKMVKSIINSTARNPYTEKMGLDSSPEVINALSRAKPATFSVKEGWLIWEGKPNSDIGNMKRSVEVNLRTGEGTQSIPNASAYFKSKTISYDTSSLSCRMESPVISLTFQ